jgi:hypothetical protein
MSKATIKTGGNQDATLDTTTTGYSLEISGTKFALIPVRIQDGATVETYYLIAAEDWAFADKADDGA